MTVLSFLIQLTSGAMLLLFSVRFMRIGIERLWSARIRQSLNEKSWHISNLAKGAGLGLVMQGSTVVMLMAAGLVGAGTIPLKSAAVLALGADFGSAIAVTFLQLPVAAINPLVILVGTSLYLRSSQPNIRNFGRVILGLGLILLSLLIIREAVEPISSLSGFSAAIRYLNSDVVSSALVGLVVTFLMHSSVAAILTAIAFSTHLSIEPTSAVGFILGCNIGSALLPFWLLQGENDQSRAVASAVGIPRCCLGAFLIFLFIVFGQDTAKVFSLAAAELMIGAHLAFNLLLMLLTPACLKICTVLDERLSNQQTSPASGLPEGIHDDITLIMPLLKKRLSAMLDLASEMLEQVTSGQLAKVAVLDLEKRMNTSLVDIRELYASLPYTETDALKDIEQILDLAIRVERCGDVMAGKLFDLRTEQKQSGFQFSREGQTEIEALIDAVRETILITQDAAWTNDTGTAERLVRQKQSVAELEAQSRAKHLARLRAGNLASLDSSDQHLETIAAFKEINSKFATIGYAILERHGSLKKTRLKSSATTS